MATSQKKDKETLLDAGVETVKKQTEEPAANKYNPPSFALDQATINAQNNYNTLAAQGYGSWSAPQYAQSQATQSAYANWMNKATQGYNGTDASNSAWNAYQNSLANKPGEFASNWSNVQSDLYNQLSNRQFNYDINADALYQQYKDQYMNQGRIAMNDAIGTASAMTGGYGNSYAATAGNQAYQSYLTQLNDKIPELYNLALNRYNSETDALSNQYNMASQMYSQDYNNYNNAYDRWQSETSNLRNDYQYADEAGRSDFNTAVNNLYNIYDATNTEDKYGYETGRNNSYDEWNSGFSTYKTALDAAQNQAQTAYNQNMDRYEIATNEYNNKWNAENPTTTEKATTFDSAYKALGYSSAEQMYSGLQEVYKTYGSDRVGQILLEAVNSNKMDASIAQGIADYLDNYFAKKEEDENPAPLHSGATASALYQANNAPLASKVATNADVQNLASQMAYDKKFGKNRVSK